MSEQKLRTLLQSNLGPHAVSLLDEALQEEQRRQEMEKSYLREQLLKLVDERYKREDESREGPPPAREPVAYQRLQMIQAAVGTLSQGKLLGQEGFGGAATATAGFNGNEGGAGGSGGVSVSSGNGSGGFLQQQFMGQQQQQKINIQGGRVPLQEKPIFSGFGSRSSSIGRISFDTDDEVESWSTLERGATGAEVDPSFWGEFNGPNNNNNNTVGHGSNNHHPSGRILSRENSDVGNKSPRVDRGQVLPLQNQREMLLLQQQRQQCSSGSAPSSPVLPPQYPRSTQQYPYQNSGSAPPSPGQPQNPRQQLQQLHIQAQYQYQQGSNSAPPSPPVLPPQAYPRHHHQHQQQQLEQQALYHSHQKDKAYMGNSKSLHQHLPQGSSEENHESAVIYSTRPMPHANKNPRKQGHHKNSLGASIPCIRLRGLPYHATPDDVANFFEGYEFYRESIRFGVTTDGRPSGEGWVSFPSMAEVHRAIQELDRKHIGDRYVELFVHSPSERSGDPGWEPGCKQQERTPRTRERHDAHQQGLEFPEPRHQHPYHHQQQHHHNNGDIGAGKRGSHFKQSASGLLDDKHENSEFMDAHQQLLFQQQQQLGDGNNDATAVINSVLNGVFGNAAFDAEVPLQQQLLLQQQQQQIQLQQQLLQQQQKQELLAQQRKEQLAQQQLLIQQQQQQCQQELLQQQQMQQQLSQWYDEQTRNSVLNSIAHSMTDSLPPVFVKYPQQQQQPQPQQLQRTEGMSNSIESLDLYTINKTIKAMLLSSGSFLSSTTSSSTGVLGGSETESPIDILSKEDYPSPDSLSYLSSSLAHQQQQQQQDLCFTCGVVGHISRDCPKANRDNCYQCGKHGHLAKDCKEGDGKGQICREFLAGTCNRKNCKFRHVQTLL